ncbi:hypothetical protein U1Q18_044170 [Sarracenia purpurea var. burkii]
MTRSWKSTTRPVVGQINGSRSGGSDWSLQPEPTASKYVGSPIPTKKSTTNLNQSQRPVVSLWTKDRRKSLYACPAIAVVVPPSRSRITKRCSESSPESEPQNNAAARLVDEGGPRRDSGGGKNGKPHDRTRQQPDRLVTRTDNDLERP